MQNRIFAVSLLVATIIVLFFAQPTTATKSKEAGKNFNSREIYLIVEQLREMEPLFQRIKNATFDTFRFVHNISSSDPRSFDELLGEVELDNFFEVVPGRHDTAMIELEFEHANVTRFVYELANYRTPNALKLLGITSAQYERPFTSSEATETVPLVLVVALGGLLLVSSGLITGFTMRKRILRKQRGVHFLDIVRLEEQMQERYDAKLEELRRGNIVQQQQQQQVMPVLTMPPLVAGSNSSGGGNALMGDRDAHIL